MIDLTILREDVRVNTVTCQDTFEMGYPTAIRKIYLSQNHPIGYKRYV